MRNSSLRQNGLQGHGTFVATEGDPVKEPVVVIHSIQSPILQDDAARTTLDFAMDLLDRDARPSFIVRRTTDLPAYLSAEQWIVYRNSSFRSYPDLEKRLTTEGQRDEQDAASWLFRTWVEQIAQRDHSKLTLSTHTYSEVIWTVVAIQDYMIVSGLPKKDVISLENNARPAEPRVEGDNVSHSVPHSGIQALWETVVDSPPSSAIGDDTKPEPTMPEQPKSKVGIMTRTPRSAHMQAFYDVDWASTELGAVETWSDNLYSLVGLVMADPEATMIFWGKNLRVIHNEEAKNLYPHVQLQGSTVEKGLPTIWTYIKAIFATVKNTREPVCLEDFPVLVNRHGIVGECWTSARFMPIEDKEGNLLGVYEVAQEITKEVLSRRRLATLLRVISCSADVREESAFWKLLLEALGENKEDIAFALLYSMQQHSQPEVDPLNRNSQRVCILECSLGVPDDHVSSQSHLSLDLNRSGYVAGILKSLEADAPVLVSVIDGSLPADYINGLKCRGYGGACRAAVVCPIRPTGAARVVGFLIVGLSSHVLYDDDFRQFINILTRQIATSVAAIGLFNEELRQQRQRAKEATLVHAKLQQRLEQETQALLTSEAKFERHLDKAPIGIVMTNFSGDITYANEAWYQISGHSGADITPDSWFALIPEEDIPDVVAHYNRIATSREDGSFEMRFKKTWTKKIDGTEVVKTPTTVLVSAYVELGEDGSVANIVGAVTDISAQKWAEESHRRRMEEAMEMKVRQENFIDTISHEMRNPLSAILQSTDELSEYLLHQQNTAQAGDKMLKNGIDAVETIALCCQHQRRIVDDVLTLSRMNADMLTVTPHESDPIKIVDGVVKMFAGDAKRHDIQIKTHIEDSLQSMGVTTLLFDSSRFAQVLVNLVSNAIKFTRGCAVRNITVVVGTSSLPPSSEDQGVEYIQNDNSTNETKHPDRVQNRVYLRVAVQDTGVGMTQPEKSRLFQRFAQASPRTHIQYGGSGLGLFISKKLCKLQEGAIGIKLGDSEGTTFAFYVSALQPEKCRSLLYGTGAILQNKNLKLITQDTNPSKHASDVSNAKTSSSRSKHSILVVEDNLINQKILCRQLRAKGFTVYAANHGVEALDLIQQTKICKGKEETGKDLSLILLDVEMPIMNGLTCVRRIRQLEAEGVLTCHIPVISVSANARQEQLDEARLAGMDDNVAKPFQVADVITRMNTFLLANG